MCRVDCIVPTRGMGLYHAWCHRFRFRRTLHLSLAHHQICVSAQPKLRSLLPRTVRNSVCWCRKNADHSPSHRRTWRKLGRWTWKKWVLSRPRQINYRRTHRPIRLWLTPTRKAIVRAMGHRNARSTHCDRLGRAVPLTTLQLWRVVLLLHKILFLQL